MKVEIITTYYKEEFLAPLFFMHYESWADKITTITTRWTDEKLDDGAKTGLINEAIAQSTADWVICVDFDEFVFPKGGTPPRKALEQEKGDIMQCEMLRVWRHMSDQDVDRMRPPVAQRRHGQPDHIKPCIFRPRREHITVQTDIGLHGGTYPHSYKWGKPWSAVHWANADPEFGIQRTHRDRQTRLSDNNYKNSWGMMPEWLDPDYLKDLYAKHMDDPMIL